MSNRSTTKTNPFDSTQDGEGAQPRATVPRAPRAAVKAELRTPERTELKRVIAVNAALDLLHSPAADMAYALQPRGVRVAVLNDPADADLYSAGVFIAPSQDGITLDELKEIAAHADDLLDEGVKRDRGGKGAGGEGTSSVRPRGRNAAEGPQHGPDANALSGLARLI